MINIKNFKTTDGGYLDIFQYINGAILNKYEVDGMYFVTIFGKERNFMGDFLTFEYAESFYYDLMNLILRQDLTLFDDLHSLDIADYGHNQDRNNKINATINKDL